MTHWDLPAPHLIELTVQAADIDAYGHVNNAVYLTWLDRAAWSHSAALGVSLQHCIAPAPRHGGAAHRDRLSAGGTAWMSAWPSPPGSLSSDAKLRVGRRFQVWRARDAHTLARAAVDYVCINLDSGRAARMPAEFTRAYVPGAPACQ